MYHLALVLFARPSKANCCELSGIPLIIAPKPAVSSSATQSFEKRRNSSTLFAREINLVTQPSFDCEQGINSQVQTAYSNADAIFSVLGIVSCRNERFSLSRKTHVHFGTHRGFRMFDCLEQLELLAACFLQLRRTLVDLIPDRMSFIVDKNCIILLFCTQIPAVRIHADVLLVAEVPLVALFDGMSFRITLLFLVFRR